MQYRVSRCVVVVLSLCSVWSLQAAAQGQAQQPVRLQQEAVNLQESAARLTLNRSVDVLRKQQLLSPFALLWSSLSPSVAADSFRAAPSTSVAAAQPSRRLKLRREPSPLRYTPQRTLLAAAAQPAAALRTTVMVNDGQRITDPQLEAGVFLGQTFTLSPDTVFEVNAGGVMGPIKSFPIVPFGNYFDFGGSTVNINSGGLFDTPSHIGNVTLNIFEGGAVSEYDLTVFTGGVVNLAGGNINGPLFMLDGSVLNMTGGRLGVVLDIGIGAVANLSGGIVKEVNTTSLGPGDASSLHINGGEFMLDGAPVSDLSAGLPTGSVLTGTLADGSVFIFEGGVDRIEPGTTTLNAVSLPPADTTPMVVATGAGPDKGLRPGQTLTLRGDATLGDHFAAVGATLNIEGGVVGDNLETAYTTVNMTGGTVAGLYRAYGSRVTISGGLVGRIRRNNLGGIDAHSGSVVSVTDDALVTLITAYDGSEINITGGRILRVFAASGSHVDISGGRPGDLTAAGGSVVDITGGVFSRDFRASSDSQVGLAGGEFMLDGAPVSDLSAGLPTGSVLAGTLADGSVFIFEGGVDRIDPGTTTLNAVSLPPADTTPMVVATGAGPDKGLRPGQTLTLRGDATLDDDFAAVGATLNIEGGVVGSGLETAYTTVNITGGTVGSLYHAYDGSRVTISGGMVDGGFSAFAGSVVTIMDDAEVRGVTAQEGSEVNIASGRISTGYQLELSDGSVANISGGSVDTVLAFAGSELNLFVQEALLDGVSLDIMPGETVLITQRGGSLLEATLADGAFFTIVLNDNRSNFGSFVSPDAVFTVTVVPAPGAVVLTPLAGVLFARRRRGSV